VDQIDKLYGHFLEYPASWLLVAFNVLLALFIWRLWITTTRLFRVTKMAAHAADLSARAAIGIELPILRVRGSQIGLADESGALDDSREQRSIISDIEIKNFGHSHAFPIQVELGYVVAKILPRHPHY